MTNKQVAESILTNVGGPTNISSVVHCATRLRFKLKDESKADTNALNQLVGVIQVVQSAGQYQVMIGSHVGDVYQELIQLASLGEQTSDQQAPKARNGNVIVALNALAFRDTILDYEVIKFLKRML